MELEFEAECADPAEHNIPFLLNVGQKYETLSHVSIASSVSW